MSKNYIVLKKSNHNHNFFLFMAFYLFFSIEELTEGEIDEQSQIGKYAIFILSF